MNNQHIPDGLMDKLLKLKNLKEGAEAVGSHAEAANAAARMQELLLKHNLTEAAIDEHGVKAKITMIHERIDVNQYQSKTEAGWYSKLVQVIAHFTMCRVVSHTMYRKANDQGDITILGDKTNVATCLYIVEQLISKIDIASKEAWKIYHGYEKRNTFMRGFLIGAVDAIHVKMEIQEEMMRRQQYESNTNLGLVLSNKREEARKYMIEIFPNIRTAKERRSSLMSQDGRSQGYEAGSRMNINKGLGSKGKGGLLN